MDKKPDLAALFGATQCDTFIGLASGASLSELDASSAFLGAPCATPYGSVGAYARNGPQSLREAIAPYSANLERHNFDLDGLVFPVGSKRAVDCGDLPWKEDDFEWNRRTIGDAITKLVTSDVVPVLIGGDDSVPTPMISAMARTGRKYTILQLDAHIDWRDEHMGETLGLSSTMRRASEMKHVEKIIQVGARGIGSAYPEDYQDALDWGVRFFTAENIHASGVDPVLREIPAGSDIIICFDIDVLDPAIAPNTIGRAPGGLSYFQALELLKGTFSRGRVWAVDVVEIMPELDVDGIGGMTVSRLVLAIMGMIARQ